MSPRCTMARWPQLGDAEHPVGVERDGKGKDGAQAENGKAHHQERREDEFECDRFRWALGFAAIPREGDGDYDRPVEGQCNAMLTAARNGGARQKMTMALW